AKKWKREMVTPRIRWWKLRKEECCMKYRDESELALVGGEKRLEDWAATAEV
ncbi:hypothetical protein SK128_000993, partial [Halocaridina rubra]